MNPAIKKIYYSLPRFLKRSLLKAYEDYYRKKAAAEILPGGLRLSPHKKNPKARILFYFISGLSYSGVSKMMQEFAKALDPSRFEAYFMYSPQARAIGGKNEREDGRKFYLEGTGVKLIEHSFASIDSAYPYVIRGMKPALFEVLKENNIDLLVTTGSGYTEFPFNLVADLPIIHFNIFGSPAVQRNIRFHVCISQEVASKISDIVYEDQIRVMPIPTAGPPPQASQWGRELRASLGYNDNDIVFGRIGRGVDPLFDPIAIRAFQKVVAEYPHIHYLIMSPMPVLEKLVAEEKIPNVRFLPASGRDEDIWAFHEAIDVMAHFRRDGESFGLNIAESMYSKKPIISHKSIYWNAHLEYLDPSFSFIAEIDDADGYAEYLRFFASDKNKEQIKAMGQKAYEKADKNFHIRHYIKEFESLIEQSLDYEK